MLNAVSLIVQLWEATLSHAPTMVPQLLAYFPYLVKIMERSFDHLQVRNLDSAWPVCYIFLVFFFYSGTSFLLFDPSNFTHNLPMNGCLI